MYFSQLYWCLLYLFANKRNHTNWCICWNWNIFWKGGDLGNQWNEAVIDLTNYNSPEVLVRLRVVTGNSFKSDIAVDKLEILAGPVTTDGQILTSVASNGTHNLIYSIEGCDDYVNVLIKEIDAGSDMIVCPTQGVFNIVGAPNGGVWKGNHITNATLGTFHPSIGLGSNLHTYSANGCIDTAYYIVVDTEIQNDTFPICSNSGTQILDMNMIPRTPWNGVWSGNGIISSNYPGEFSPGTAGIGNHTITYTANTCIDNFIIKVLPPSILADTLICSSSSDIILDINPMSSYKGNIIRSTYEPELSPEEVLSYKLISSFKGNRDTPRIGLRGTAKVYGNRTILFYYLFRKPITFVRQLIGV